MTRHVLQPGYSFAEEFGLGLTWFLTAWNGLATPNRATKPG